MRQSAVTFKADGLSFEGVVAQPEGEASGLPGVVVCHPHPLFGGNMDNNVVMSVCFALAEQGIVTLRFNFRGVGASEGEHTKGEQEYKEAKAALDLIKAWPGVNARRVGLAGYSFGASVVLGSEALQKSAKAVALISPPIRALESSPLRKRKQPVFLISGDRDKLVQSDEFEPVLSSFQNEPDCHIVEGADHYWVGYEDQLGPRINRFFAEHLT